MFKKMKNIIHDEFKIIDRKNNMITIKGHSYMKKYIIESSGRAEEYKLGIYHNEDLSMERLL